MLATRTRDSLGPIALMLAIVVGILLAFRIAHAGAMASPGVPGIDWTFWLALAGAALGGLSAVLHVIAPRTKTTWDDNLRDEVDEVLAWYRGAKPTLTPVKGSRGPFGGAAAMLAVLLLGAVGAGLATSCAHDQRATFATDAKHTLINCTAQPLGTTPGLDLGTLAAVVNLTAEERLKCMTPTGLDWHCVEMDAIGQGLTVGGCAFVQLVAAAAKAIAPAASGLAETPTEPPPGRAELEDFRRKAGGASGASWHTATGDY